jgi:hypothetical protein
VTRVDEHRRSLWLALAFALCLIAGSTPRIVGDGGEYLAQALNFSDFNRPSLGRQAIPVIERRIIELEPALAEWSIERATVAGPDRRRDFLHFWFYALLATPFVWLTDLVGVSPLHAFTALNLLLLGVALRLALPRVGAPATVLLFLSPLVWWIDKAHTEVFTVALLAIAMLLMCDRPWWALVASGAAATQNPPITAVVLLIGAATLVERRLAALTDRRIVVGAIAGAGLAALQPIYTYLRHDTPSLLLYATQPGFPTGTELAASVFDPSMGLIGNFPIFLLGTGLATAWLALRHPRRLLTTRVGVAAITTAVFLYAFAQTSNPHHGATPSLTRYALWFIPMSLAVWVPFGELSGARARRGLTLAAGASALVSIFAFHPGVQQNTREPTWLASWLWTQHPAWNNPLPEVFSETLLGVEGTTVPVATPGCEKVLLAAGAPGTPMWPVPCLPAPLPASCQVPGTLCYANRRGAEYDFVVAPGRELVPRHMPEAVWPLAAEPHVRQFYLAAQWPTLVTRAPGALDVLRAQHDVRVAAFGDNARFLLVLRPTGPGAVLHFRPHAPLRGEMMDGSTGEPIGPLSFEGTPGELWMIDVPSRPGGLIVLTLQQAGEPSE